MAKSATKYKVLVGLNYPSTRVGTEVRAEEGDVVDDFPGMYAGALVEAGVLEPYSEDQQEPAPKPEPEGGEQ